MPTLSKVASCECRSQKARKKQLQPAERYHYMKSNRCPPSPLSRSLGANRRAKPSGFVVKGGINENAKHTKQSTFPRMHDMRSIHSMHVSLSLYMTAQHPPHPPFFFLLLRESSFSSKSGMRGVALCLDTASWEAVGFGRTGGV